MTYQLFDLPVLPQNFIDRCIETVENNDPFFNVVPSDMGNFNFTVGFGMSDDWPDDGFNHKSKKEAFDYIWNTGYRAAQFSLYTPNSDVIDWVYSNIPDKIKEKYTLKEGAIELVKIHNGDMLFPHADPTTGYSHNLNFVIWDGGKNTVTKFFEPKPEHLGKKIINTVPYRFETIDVVNEVRLEKHTWGMLPRGQIHSVCNLEKPRLLLQIGAIKNEV